MKVKINMAALTLKLLSKSKLVAPAFARAFSVSANRLIGEGPHYDEPTHTGQLWDPDDYRNIRFVDKDKLWCKMRVGVFEADDLRPQTVQINPNWAIDLIAEDPVVVVKGHSVWSNSCGALGHPKVYINLDKPEVAVCGYSGRKFIQKKYYNEQVHGPSITYDEYLEQMEGDFR